MQLPAFSGRKKTINLLPKDAFESSGLGVILEWALSFGKWSVILTQLVVMAVFLWRFGLDRQLTNIRREIEQQEAVIRSYSQVETDFVLAQRRVAYIRPTIANQKKLIDTMEIIQGSTPTDVWYERVSVNDTGVNMTAYAASLSGFSRLLNAVQRRPEFNSVNVGSIESGGAGGAQLRFDLSLGYGAKR